MAKAIKTAYHRDGAVRLDAFLEKKALAEVRKELLKKKRLREYHPLKHRWEKARVKVPELEAFIRSITGKRMKGTLYLLRPGDYSLLHDDLKMVSALGLLDLTERWDDSWGGYLGAEQEKLELGYNSLLLLKGPLRWWLKRVSLDATKPRVLLLLTTVRSRSNRSSA